MTNPLFFNRIASRLLSNLIPASPQRGNWQVFEKIIGYDGIKRTFLRSLTSKEPVHILLVGPPGQARTLFLKCILETFGEKKAFFTVGGNASKSGLIDVLFDTQPKFPILSLYIMFPLKP